MTSCTSTAQECNAAQNMCPIIAGDTLPFVFTFTQEDGTPLQTGDMFIEFTMKIHPDDADDGEGVLYKKEVFPPPVEPATGIEYMTLTSEDTSVLIPGKNYYYKFKLTNPIEPIEEVFTLGYGQVMVL